MKAALPAARDLAADFFRKVAEPVVFAELFDVLPDVFLFIKDRAHRYVKVNRSLALLHGCRAAAEVVGRTDHDFNPPVLATQYVAEDRRVLSSGQPLLDQVWLVQDAAGMPGWYISSKYPVRGPRRSIIGIAGVMRRYELAGGAPGDYQRLTPACEYVLANYGQSIALADLAQRAHLSESQLQREFRRLFGMNPSDYVLRVRLMMAGRLLEKTTQPAGQIALDCGFYDQSHFTRAFQAANGLSPVAYRRRFKFQAGRAQSAGAKTDTARLRSV